MATAPTARRLGNPGWLRVLNSDQAQQGIIYMSENPTRQRVGLFGGTFDPIHLGHLLIAEHSKEYLNLDEVRFIPAATAPHKQDRESVDGKHRQEMVRLAIGGNSSLVADDRELRRGGTSYTIDTLQELTDEMPGVDFVFVMGSDSLAELSTWREPEKICRLAFVAVVARGGEPKPDLALLGRYLPGETELELERHLVPMPQIEINSTEIRRRIADGRSIRYQVPAAVEAYIRANQLYR